LKRYVIISITLHLLLIAAILFLIPQKEKESKPFIATIVTPEELATKKEPPRPVERPKKQQRRVVQNVRTGETGTPKNLFAVPKGRTANKEKPAREQAVKNTAAPSPSGTHMTTESKTKEIPFKNKMFDTAILEKTAIASRARTAMSAKSGGISFYGGQGQNFGWLQRVSEKLAAVWKYPRELSERRIFGDVDVRITFKKNGELGPVELLRTSGYRVLDDSVMRALKDANPYWPLPDDWQEDELTIVGHFMSQ
jgi:protein TonB